MLVLRANAPDPGPAGSTAWLADVVTHVGQVPGSSTRQNRSVRRVAGSVSGVGSVT